jgi:outer membrane protein TolC
MSNSRRPRNALIFLLLLFHFVAARSAAGIPMSMEDSIATAVRENRTIKNAYLDRVAQKYDLRVAEDKFTPKLLLTPSLLGNGGKGTTATAVTTDLAGTITELLPTGAAISLNANYDFTRTVNTPPGRTSSWGVSLIQPFLKGGGVDVNMASVRTARLTDQDNILTLKSTLISTLTTVVTAYRGYVQAVKALEISKQSLGRSKALVDINRELISAGRMAAIEIVQSEADVAGKEFSLLSAENDVEAARLALTKAIDIDKNSRITPVEEKGIPPVPYTLAEGTKLALENRPDYQSLLLGYENAKIQLLVSKNNTLWDLSLTGGYVGNRARGGATGGAGLTNSWYTGLLLTVPIGDLSIRQGYITAEVALKKAENTLASQRESVEIEVENALRSADMNLRQIKLATLSRVLSEKKVDIETEKLKAGRSTNFQLVSFQNDLVNAQNSELGAIITYLNALTTLDQTLGITLDRLGVSLVERKE